METRLIANKYARRVGDKMKNKLFKEQKLSIIKIEKELGLDKMYLYRYIGNYNKIKKIPYIVLYGISQLENIEVNELYNKMLIYSLQSKEEIVE